MEPGGTVETAEEEAAAAAAVTPTQTPSPTVLPFSISSESVLKPYMPFIVGGVILALLAFIIYLFRDYIKPCVRWIEIVLEYIVRALLLPLRFLAWLLRKMFYPVKELVLLGGRKVYAFFNPATVRI